MDALGKQCSLWIIEDQLLYLTEQTFLSRFLDRLPLQYILDTIYSMDLVFWSNRSGQVAYER